MRGHARIIAARMQGMKPAGWVIIDVGLRSDQNMLCRTNGMEVVPGVPLNPYVCLSPAESARTADWTWVIGLSVQVDGDDLPRVEAAHERICAAGAARVVSSCVLSRDDVRVFDSAGGMS